MLQPNNNTSQLFENRNSLIRKSHLTFCPKKKKNEEKIVVEMLKLDNDYVLLFRLKCDLKLNHKAPIRWCFHFAHVMMIVAYIAHLMFLNETFLLIFFFCCLFIQTHEKQFNDRNLNGKEKWKRIPVNWNFSPKYFPQPEWWFQWYDNFWVLLCRI